MTASTVELQAKLTQKPADPLPEVVIYFAGDSGDGIQAIGGQFGHTCVRMGNDILTFPDFPAEIRAPAGTRAGVSGYQLRFGNAEVLTPGDGYDALVAFNPAALLTRVKGLKTNGILIVNSDKFGANDLNKAHCKVNPLEDGSLDRYQVYRVDLTKMTRLAVFDSPLPAPLSPREGDRCQNFFALGMVCWLYQRSLEPTADYIKAKFGKRAEVAEANRRALVAGWSYCENTDSFSSSFTVAPAKLPPGLYRHITGNQATAMGIVAAGQKAGLPVFYGSYPITPASDILHALARYKHMGVTTVQAEDEIAAACMAIGAAYSGSLAFTATSGPGLDLKQEAISLAISTEMPFVIVDVQRGGPSTGLPTKTEQADLFAAMYGRHGESPLPVLAANQPSDCFACVYEATRIAVKYRTPVIFLSDGYLANGAEPWLIPSAKDLPPIASTQLVESNGIHPFKRDAETLARPWVRIGTPGLEYRVGGIEKDQYSGNISYEPDNHEAMSLLRKAKIDGIAREIPPTAIDGPASGDLLVVGWGSTYGSIKSAVDRKRREGKSVAHVHLRFLNPLPPDLGAILGRYKKVLVPEMNLGQLVEILRARFVIPAIPLSKVKGQPFTITEIADAIDNNLKAPEVLNASELQLNLKGM
jgi:2-oxoglutarate/2-oxoacid ferredoxin oxidoreductase subunit alpha